MTYATEAAKVGRKPLTVVEIDLSTCGLTFGVNPCTASGAAGTECFNTRSTCQDVANFDSGGPAGGSVKTYRFVEPLADLPVGQTWHPCLVSASVTPQQIEPGKGLGKRQSVTVTLQDFPHHDRGVDPYVATRSSVQGEFFRKLIARNPYYVGRELRVLNGFVGEPFAWGDFTTHTYVIDRIDGPDRQGRISIVAKDILKLADDKKAQAPVASTGKLSVAMTAGDTSLTLDTGSGPDYGTSGTVRIGSEIITFTGRTGDQLTGLTRGTSGTTAATHSIDDLVQLCLVYTNQNVRAIIDDLFVTYGNIPSSYIPAADWNTERDIWLLGYTLSATISKPTGVTKLIEELCEQCQLTIWWDDSAQQIKLKAVMPPRGLVNEITQDNILADSVAIKALQDDRISQVWVYWNQIDLSEDNKEENFKSLVITADLDAESAQQYGEKKVKVIKSRWITSEGQAQQTASRFLTRYRDYAREMRLALDANDANAIKTGDTVQATTDQIVGVDGVAFPTQFQVVASREVDTGTRYEYTLLESTFAGKRYAFVAPNSTPDYTSATATQKSSYSWISNTTPEMSNGDEPYRII